MLKILIVSIQIAAEKNSQYSDKVKSYAGFFGNCAYPMLQYFLHDVVMSTRICLNSTQDSAKNILTYGIS